MRPDGKEDVLELWRRLRDFLLTDVEVVFALHPDEPLQLLRSETNGGACVSITTDDDYRHVFFGSFGSFAFSLLVLRDPLGNLMAVSRGPFGRVLVMTSAVGLPLERRVQEHDLRVSLGGEGVRVPDPRGGEIRIRRLRHRDFRLYPEIPEPR